MARVRRTCWAITRGSYSDYRVLAVFASRADAEAAIARAKGAVDSFLAAESVEEMSFYEEGVEPVLLTVYERQVEVWDDGTVSSERRTVREEWDYDPLYDLPGKRPKVRFVRAPIHKDKGGRLEVRGTDEQGVNQAFSDNLAQLRLAAEQTGKAAL